MATIGPPPVSTPPPSILISETVVPTAERSSVASPIGWPSILAATVLSLGVWLLLHLFGIAIGLTTLDQENTTGSLRAAGIGVGIWSLIAPLLALFVGGLVAGRIAPTINTLNAAIHGSVVWALTLLAMMFLVINMLGSVARNVTSAGSALAGGAVDAAGAIGGSDVSLGDVGLDADAAFAPLNEELKQRGAAPVSPERAKAAAQEVARTAIKNRDISRAEVIDIVARRTELSRADAERVAGELEVRARALGQQGRELAEDAKTTAVDAADTTGKALLALCGMMVLSLGAAVGGSIVSVRRERREHVLVPRASTRTPA